MTPNPFLRYILSPLMTLLLIILAHFIYLQGYFVSLGLPIMGLSLCLFWSGLKANILSAVLITGYAFLNPVYDTSRFIQLLLTVWPVAIVGGLFKRWLIESVKEAEHYRLRLLDTFNGNKAKLNEAIYMLDDLRDGWKTIPNGERLERVEAARGKLADLVLLVDSYHQMAEDRRLVEGTQEAKSD